MVSKIIKLYVLKIHSKLYQLLIIITISVTVLYYKGLANSSLQSNYVLVDSLTNLAGHHLLSFLHHQTIDTCSVSISAHPAHWLLLQKLVSGKEIIITEMNSAHPNRAEIQIQDCAVRYFLYNESNDSLIREGQISIKGVLHKSGILNEIPQFVSIIRDTIARSDIAYLQIPSYPFTVAPIPESPKGFFTEIAEPLLFITAAAVTVLLLFTVRSQ